jgi:nitrate/nitrite transporter NarK
MPAAGATSRPISGPLSGRTAPDASTLVRMAVVALTLAVLLVGQDLVAYVNRPRG